MKPDRISIDCLRKVVDHASDAYSPFNYVTLALIETMASQEQERNEAPPCYGTITGFVQQEVSAEIAEALNG